MHPLQPIDAAQAILAERYPGASTAFLAGSVVRGEGTATSDLDLVVVLPGLKSAFRESFRAHGWPVEAFVHTECSLQDFFEDDCRRRRPSLPQMVAEGIVLVDADGRAEGLKRDARSLLEAGPPPLAPAEIEMTRYMLTDMLEDLEGSRVPAESLYIAHELAAGTAAFVLALNRRWTGRGKWLHRALGQHDPALAQELAEALATGCRSGEYGALVGWVDRAIAPAGGRLFEGFSRGK